MPGLIVFLIGLFMPMMCVVTPDKYHWQVTFWPISQNANCQHFVWNQPTRALSASKRIDWLEMTWGEIIKAFNGFIIKMYELYFIVYSF